MQPLLLGIAIAIFQPVLEVWLRADCSGVKCRTTPTGKFSSKHILEAVNLHLLPLLLRILTWLPEGLPRLFQKWLPALE